MKGVVSNYIEKKGFGFIKGEDGSSDIFFHISDVKNEIAMERGDKVSFEKVAGKKGPVAKKINKIGKANSQFIDFGNVSLKFKNIKTFGIANNQTEEKYEIEREISKGEKVAATVINILLAVSGSDEGVSHAKEYKYETLDHYYLFVETYQNENYRFYKDEVSFDIYKKLNELKNFSA